MEVNNVAEAVAAHVRGRAHDRAAAAFALEEDLPAGPMPESPEALFYPQAVDQRGPGYEAVEVKKFFDRAYAAAPCLLRLAAREFQGVRLVVAGGFCLSVLQGQPVKDMDVFLIVDSGVPTSYLDKCCRDAAAALKPHRCVYRRGVLELWLPAPPHRVQFILRPYDSMSTLLNSFDLAASGMGFDGKKLWVTPASLWCTRARVCPLNPEFRSPSFELRAEKYFRLKGYALAVPGALAELGAARTLVCGVRDPNKPSLIIEVARDLGQNAFAARACVDGGPLWQYFGEVAGAPGPSNAARLPLREKYDQETRFNVEKILRALHDGTPFNEINWLVSMKSVSRQVTVRDVFKKANFDGNLSVQDFVVEQLKTYRGLNIRRLFSLYPAGYVRAVLGSHLSEQAPALRGLTPEEQAASRRLSDRSYGGNYANLSDAQMIKSLTGFLIENRSRAVDLFVLPGNDSTSSFVPQPTPVGEWLRALPGAPPAPALPDVPKAPGVVFNYGSEDLFKTYLKLAEAARSRPYHPPAVRALRQMRELLKEFETRAGDTPWRVHEIRRTIFECEQLYCSVSTETLDVLAKMMYGRLEADPGSLESAWNAAWAWA
jgi:hypothetical protein